VVAGTAESLVFVDGKRGSSWFGDFKASLGNRVKLYKWSQTWQASHTSRSFQGSGQNSGHKNFKRG